MRSADEYVLADGHAPNAVRFALAGGVPEDRLMRAIAKLRVLLENPPRDLPV